MPTHTSRTATEYYRCIKRTAHTDTLLAHDALHCKNLENRSIADCTSVVTNVYGRVRNAKNRYPPINYLTIVMC